MYLDLGAGVFGYAAGVRSVVLLFGIGVFACAACNGKATKEQCNEMLDKYLDMTIAGEQGSSDLTPAEQRAAREMKKALRKNEPSYARVATQCETEITKAEYRCAMKAPTPETWQACID
jgi:hypothetical protein